MKTKPQVSFGHVSLDIDDLSQALYGISVRPAVSRTHLNKSEAIEVLRYHNRDADDIEATGIHQSLERQVSKMEGISIDMKDGRYFA